MTYPLPPSLNQQMKSMIDKFDEKGQKPPSWIKKWLRKIWARIHFRNDGN